MNDLMQEIAVWMRELVENLRMNESKCANLTVQNRNSQRISKREQKPVRMNGQPSDQSTEVWFCFFLILKNKTCKYSLNFF